MTVLSEDAAMAVSVLGPLRVQAGGMDIEVRPGQQKAVLALLALAGGQPVRRTEFITALWDDQPPTAAWNVIQTHVKQLRSLLEPRRVARAPSTTILTVADGYALTTDPDRVDLLRFRQLVEASRTAYREQRLSTAFSLLGRGLALWRGRPLADIPILTDRPIVEVLDRERWAAVGWQMEIALVLGRAGEVVGQAEAAVRALPLDERAAARLVRAYHSTGRPGDASDAFRQARRRLADALGVEPGPDLAAAHREALRNGVARPGDTGDQQNPTAPAASIRPAQLPADIVDFVGRRPQIDQVRQALRDHKGVVPIAAVVGMAGVGKTTLAIHLGHQLAGDFPDGQLYVRLHGGSGHPADPAHVLGRLLQGLGVTGSAIPDGLDERAALYRTR